MFAQRVGAIEPDHCRFGGATSDLLKLDTNCDNQYIESKVCLQYDQSTDTALQQAYQQVILSLPGQQWQLESDDQSLIFWLPERR